MTYRARLLPFDAIRREQKMNMSSFRRSRVVVSQSNRNCEIDLARVLFTASPRKSLHMKPTPRGDPTGLNMSERGRLSSTTSSTPLRQFHVLVPFYSSH